MTKFQSVKTGWWKVAGDHWAWSAARCASDDHQGQAITQLSWIFCWFYWFLCDLFCCFSLFQITFWSGKWGKKNQFPPCYDRKGVKQTNHWGVNSIYLKLTAFHGGPKLHWVLGAVTVFGRAFAGWAQKWSQIFVFFVSFGEVSLLYVDVHYQPYHSQDCCQNVSDFTPMAWSEIAKSRGRSKAPCR